MAKVDRTPLDQPTRGSIQQLFRNINWRSCGYGTKYRLLDDEYDAKLEEFKNTPEMKTLEKKREAARNEGDRISSRLKAMISKAHRRFLATGLTPATLKLINELIDELDKVGATEE
jgi:hypothetical protein